MRHLLELSKFILAGLLIEIGLKGRLFDKNH